MILLRLDSNSWKSHLLRTGFNPASTGSVFISLEWFEALAKHTLDGATHWAYALAESIETPPVALFFVQSPAGQPGSILNRWGWKCSQSTVSSLSNHQTCRYGAVVRSDFSDDPSIYYKFGSELGRLRPRAPLVDFNFFPEGSRELVQLTRGLSEAGYLIHEYVYKGAWYEDLEGLTFKDYVATRPKSARKALKNYERKARKLESDRGMTFSMICDDSAIDEVIENYLEVEAASWKKSEPHPEFIPAVIRQAAASGRLRLGMVCLDNRCVAIELAILHDRHATMLRTHYAESEAASSVGAIAILYTMRHLLDCDQIRSVDFGVDDDEYKRIWVQQRQEIRGVVGVDPRSAEGLHALCRLRLVTFSEWLRSSKLVRGVRERAAPLAKRLSSSL